MCSECGVNDDGDSAQLRCFGSALEGKDRSRSIWCRGGSRDGRDEGEWIGFVAVGLELVVPVFVIVFGIGRRTREGNGGSSSSTYAKIEAQRYILVTQLNTQCVSSELRAHVP